jgi:hypothetical protein
MDTKKILASALVVALFAATAFADKLISESRRVELGKAETARVKLHKSNGEFKIGPGADALLEGDFEYSVKAWKPVLTTATMSGKKTVILRQPPSLLPVLGRAVNKWDVRLRTGVPLELEVDNSSGNLHADLAGLELITADIESSSGGASINMDGDYKMLTEIEGSQSSGNMEFRAKGKFPKMEHLELESSSGDLDVNMDGVYGGPLAVELGSSSGEVKANLAGEFTKPVEMKISTSSADVEADLTGMWKSGLEAEIESSSGSVTVKLPTNVGISVEAEVNSGSISADGFIVRGDHYVNEHYGKSPVTLDLEMETSSGDIELIK